MAINHADARFFGFFGVYYQRILREHLTDYSAIVYKQAVRGEFTVKSAVLNDYRRAHCLAYNTADVSVFFVNIGRYGNAFCDGYIRYLNVGCVADNGREKLISHRFAVKGAEILVGVKECVFVGRIGDGKVFDGSSVNTVKERI